MARAYETTYQRFHKKHEINKRKSLAPVDHFCEDSLPAGGKWIVRQTLEEKKNSGYSLEDAEEAVKQMYKNRYWTTYQLHYCADMIPKAEFIEETADNELLASCRLVYNRKEHEILPPRPSARRVFGYLRPSYCYTPLTMYQLVHGTTAYKLMEANCQSDKKELPKASDGDSDNSTKKEKENIATGKISKVSLRKKPKFRNLTLGDILEDEVGVTCDCCDCQ